jgi:uncharacterized protein (TIGR02391 family)
VIHSIQSVIPDAKSLLALQPEELASILLEYLVSLSDHQLHRRNAFLGDTIVRGYPQNHHEAIKRALVEAWVWLEREGLIAPKPDSESRDWVFITRRGHELSTRGALDAYRQANLLPREQIHPKIVDKVYSAFLRGDYDVAVFEAFKEVEIAVRAAAGFTATDIGVGLMRRAFAVPTGPLTDPTLVTAEQQGMSDLFAGAIGLCKNPQSHRSVVLGAAESVELIMFGTYLLRLVDAALTRRQSPTP